MDNLKDKMADAAASFGKEAGDVAGNLQSRASDAWDSVQHQTNRAVRESYSYVREHSVTTALAAFGIGLVVGLLVNRRDPVSFKDRSIAEPLHQSKGMLLGLLLAFVALIRRTFSSASIAAGEVAGNVGDDLKDSLKPLRRAARKTGEKLGL